MATIYKIQQKMTTFNGKKTNKYPWEFISDRTFITHFLSSFHLSNAICDEERKIEKKFGITNSVSSLKLANSLKKRLLSGAKTPGYKFQFRVVKLNVSVAK